MGLPYLAAIRFLASNHADEFVREILNAASSIVVDAGTEQLFSLVAKRVKETPREKTILPLIPVIRSSAASEALGYVALETVNGNSQENWRFIPRYEIPVWLEVEFDALTSTRTNERLVWSHLRQLVDQKLMDVAVGAEGYYGFAPLIFLLRRTRQIERGVEASGNVAANAADLPSELSAAFGQLEDMRKLEPQFVPARQVTAWTREWQRRNANAGS